MGTGHPWSRPASSRSRGLGALPGAFQALQPLLSRPPPRGWRLPASSGQSRAAGGYGLWWPRELKKTRAPRGLSVRQGQRPAFLSSQTVLGEMGPGSQRALVLFLLLLACPRARASQVSVPAASPGVPLPEEVTPRLGHARFHSCAGVGGLEWNLGLGFGCWREEWGPPSVIAEAPRGPGDLGGPGLQQPSRVKRLRVGIAGTGKLLPGDF